MRIVDIMVNRLTRPMGFSFGAPRFSWKVVEARGKRQTSARVVVSKQSDLTNPLFDRECADADSLCFAPDIALEPRTRYFWRVTVATDAGETAVSDIDFFETGKMNEAWQAKWIAAEGPSNFVADIDIEKPVASARAYASALGVYELYIGGRKAGDELLAPFCNDYENWLQTQTYDITSLLAPGKNVLRALVGDGWAVGRFGFQGATNIYAKRPAFLCEIRIQYADGTEDVLGTGESFFATDSKVRFSNIYDGEQYDATQDDETRRRVEIEENVGFERLTDRLSPPVRVTQRIPAAQIIHTPAGETVIDLGQEITGYLEFICHAPRGARLKMSYFEILQGGNYYRDNLRSAKEEYEYVSDGQIRAVRPFHTFFGFRYVKLEGFDEPNLADFTGCAVHSDLKRTLTFDSSNEKVNRFAQNALWGQRGNFLDVPTDCPQRDERMGWTGDAQAFSGTACFQMDSAAFFQKYLHDALGEQRKLGGMVPHVVPSFGMPGGGSCAWGDMACVIPWTAYLFYGDKAALEAEYENMRLWVDWIKGVDDQTGGSRLWRVGFHFADWLALDTKDGSVFGGTDPYFVATAYYYYSTSLLVQASKALGWDASAYEKLLDEIRDAIEREYFTPAGRMAQTTQTAYVCALFMGFAPEKHRARLAELLDKELNDTHGKLRTGFVGTAYLCRALTMCGLNRRAYELLLNEEYPGWLYEVNMGATTVWERWNSVLPDGSISDTGMNSLNHYAYGAVMEWVYRDAAGLNPVFDAPGFRKARIEPHPDYLLPRVSVKFDSPMGLYESSWEILKNRFVWDVEIPFGATAEIVFPEGNKDALAKAYPELAYQTGADGKLRATAPSGRYRFDYQPARPLHKMVSLDLSASELMAIPEAKKAVFEAFPQLMRMADRVDPNEKRPLRAMLVDNPFMKFDPAQVQALDEKLRAMD